MRDVSNGRSQSTIPFNSRMSATSLLHPAPVLGIRASGAADLQRPQTRPRLNPTKRIDGIDFLVRAKERRNPTKSFVMGYDHFSVLVSNLVSLLLNVTSIIDGLTIRLGKVPMPN